MCILSRAAITFSRPFQRQKMREEPLVHSHHVLCWRIWPITASPFAKPTAKLPETERTPPFGGWKRRERGHETASFQPPRRVWSQSRRGYTTNLVHIRGANMRKRKLSPTDASIPWQIVRSSPVYEVGMDEQARFFFARAECRPPHHRTLLLCQQ